MFLKPEASTVNGYWPGFRSTMRKNPVSFVLAVCFSPVEAFSARTNAPETAAPLASVIVPDMSPVIFWANREMLEATLKRTRNETPRRRRSPTILPPPCFVLLKRTPQQTKMLAAMLDCNGVSSQEKYSITSIPTPTQQPNVDELR